MTCENCFVTLPQPGRLCTDCLEEQDYLEWLDSTPSIKSVRREEQRERGRYGMVKHLEPNVRPMKMPKARIR